MILLAILAAISLAALLAWLSGDGAPADEVSRIKDAIRELDGAHYPTTYGDGRPELCATCGAADGSWPCVSRQVADDLRRAIGDE